MLRLHDGAFASPDVGKPGYVVRIGCARQTEKREITRTIVKTGGFKFYCTQQNVNRTSSSVRWLKILFFEKMRNRISHMELFATSHWKSRRVLIAFSTRRVMCTAENNTKNRTPSSRMMIFFFFLREANKCHTNLRKNTITEELSNHGRRRTILLPVTR